MTEHTKRTLRTIVQVAIGVATAAPEIANHLPADIAVAQIVTVSALVCHYFYLLEAIPGFPAWLKLNVAPKQ